MTRPSCRIICPSRSLNVLNFARQQHSAHANLPVELAGGSMSRLEFDDLRLLADIRPRIAHLIAKQLVDDKQSGKISSFDVHNALCLFRYGVDAIPVYLPSESDFTPESFRYFAKRLNRLLGLFENLVREEILAERPLRISDDGADQSLSQEVKSGTEETQCHSSVGSIPKSSRFPKLEALSRRISPKPEDMPHQSAFLRLPSTAKEAEEANRIVSEFNDSNDLQTTRADPKPNRAPSVTRKKLFNTESQTTSSSQNCFTSLWESLTRNMNTSGCTSTHVAKIQVRHPGRAALKSDEIEHKVFISCCPNLDKWQETTCEVISELPRNSNLKQVRNICKVIHGSLQDGMTLKIVIHDDGIVRDPSAARRIRLPQVLPTLSLDTILRDDNQNLHTYHKITLALNLSCSLSRMYHGGIRTEWTSQDILFLFNQDKGAVSQAYNPYVPYSLSQQTHYTDSESTGIRKFSLLIAFGKLLIEIALGRILEESELSDYPRADVALWAIIDDPKEEIRAIVPFGYVEAIEECLQANRDDDYDEESDDGEGLDEELQILGVLTSVIENLENSRTRFLGNERKQNPEFDPNFPKEWKVSRSLLRQTTFPRSSNSQRLLHENSVLVTDIANDASAQSLSQLFDGGNDCIKSTDEKATSADKFMCLVKDFYEAHIKNLPRKRRIRIAILDTGVDESNLFIRGVCKTMKRRNGDSPFRKIKSFIGRSGLDEFGHGTNVAALVLRVAPEADLYIAQISQTKEEANKIQIAEAIEWARTSEVDIISMSFGMSEDCYEIEKAIGQAENDNIIIFAAASNYGGNQRRAFPARMDKVLCVHSSDGDGIASGFNPSPKADRENFTTLGEGIESVWEDGVYLHGTSYATPIVAGFAANVLQYIWNCPLLQERHRKKASTRVGMMSLLVAMSEKRGDFYYVSPWRRIWTLEEGEREDVIAFRISEALKYDR
ncbi:Putative peptidase S8/S53 domain, peptidase S8, subtilisin, Ser-active [Colletotrichum destructivum]|uniref:Peptidase S8/S53 domain, peptidase S8, subtilisin, Ser-active n=1 Tax=Colletotrichum destructivum TaxID=34406 RepID=A0AAX4I1K6_9PEZI|nr:Putative peptidase S8/S53 domain, peptidase S8, subtilisin, Ser-active [Colletotrichum destructivum]